MISTPSDPTPNEVLPDGWGDWILEWRKWGDEDVPQDIQDYVCAMDDRLLSVGRHPDGRYFLVEVFDMGNSEDYFVGWWHDVKPI